MHMHTAQQSLAAHFSPCSPPDASPQQFMLLMQSHTMLCYAAARCLVTLLQEKLPYRLGQERLARSAVEDKLASDVRPVD